MQKRSGRAIACFVRLTTHRLELKTWEEALRHRGSDVVSSGLVVLLNDGGFVDGRPGAIMPEGEIDMAIESAICRKCGHEFWYDKNHSGTCADCA